MSRPQLVIDTNVLVSALRSGRGASARLVAQIGTDAFDMHITVPLVLEYEEVLLRQRAQLELTHQEVADVIDAVCALAVPHDIFFLWRPFLRDPRDHLVLEAAVTGRCTHIVTYNQRDFQGVERFGIRVVTAREMLENIENR